ncbi:hypothetical protein KM043_013887 [Ampulex compressa]|nr:hypothetical protein KM043_013887 [Ampulex compressa]
MGQGTEGCADRPTEVSVIRFVSRNRTIEEIAPKKEIYTCKQRGCGKIFTNQDEYKTHEALEALKIRFICREPGCGEELSDPGSMWRHYQEWHNNETSVYVCPYTNCGSLHATSGALEEHVEGCHRQPPTLPTEPEVICFEGLEDSELQKNRKPIYFESSKDSDTQKDRKSVYFQNDEDSEPLRNRKLICYDGTEDCQVQKTRKSIYFESSEDPELQKSRKSTYFQCNEDSKLQKSRKSIYFESSKESEVQKNKKLICLKDSERQTSRKLMCFEGLDNLELQKNKKLIYFEGSEDSELQKNGKLDCFESSEPQKNKKLLCFENSEDAELQKTRNSIRFETTEDSEFQKSRKSQDRSTDVEEYPRNEELRITEESFLGKDDDKNEDYEVRSEDEEYTPKKQRVSRYKQETYRCEVDGCGKRYRYISHYRHHQDTHKLAAVGCNVTKGRLKLGRASTVSYFLCKIPGCGAEVNNVTGLWKHYQDNHANAKPPTALQVPKNREAFR